MTGPGMSGMEEEIDFSSYLVDLGEQEDDAGGKPRRSENEMSRNLGLDYATINMQHDPLRTHLTNSWSDALLSGSVASVSPSPPETTYDKASTGSTSTTSTAASSVVSTSYPGYSGSWMTERGKVGCDTYSQQHSETSWKDGEVEPQSYVNHHSRSKSSSVSGIQSSLSSSTVPFSVPPLNLSFSYDFAHDPSLNPAFAITPSKMPDVSSSSGYNPNNGAWLSGNRPSQNASQVQGLSSPFQRNDKVTSTSATILGNKDVAPSSGPTSSTHRSSKSRQSSNIVDSAIPPNNRSMGPPQWAQMNSASPSISQLPTSHPGKPYARPAVHENSNNTLLVGTAPIPSMSASAKLQKRPSKRKSASTSHSSLFASLPTTSSSIPPSRLQPLSISPVSSYVLPSPGYLYRDPVLGLISPMSSTSEQFSPLPIHSVNASAAASPSQQDPLSAAPTTSRETVPSSTNVPSPLDPHNFHDYGLDSLAISLETQHRPIQATNTPESASTYMQPVDFDKAVALAGIGGKWFNWASQQQSEAHSPTSSILSSLLTDEASLFPTPSMNSTSATSPKSNVKSEDLNREIASNLQNPNDWPDINGQSPETMAANDPLATQLWRLYAKAKAGLPSGARMENITWRMMSLKLNKQKAAAEKAAEVPIPTAFDESSTLTSSPSVAPIPAETTEQGRGRKGRSPSISVSPKELGDLVDMDWREQSRSRSRPPAASTMDWREMSRSRSRAPNSRTSLTPGSNAFQNARTPMPYSEDGVASRDNAWPDDYGKSILLASNIPVMAATEFVKGDGEGITAVHETGHESNAPRNLTLVNHTVFNAGALTTYTSPSSEASKAGLDYASPVSLPISTGAWLHTGPRIPGLEHGSTSSSTPLHYQQLSNLPPMPMSDPNSNTIQSKLSLSNSVEAYLLSLNHNTSIIDLPAHRHACSVPGLFHEQDLDINHHADYGYLPRLVRKTSFDASYPASIVQQQRKGANPPEVSGFESSANVSYHPGLNGSNRGYVAQSTPGTPTVGTSSGPFDFSISRSSGPASAIASPDSNSQQGESHIVTHSASHSAAIEAFRRLQAAQALQAANAHQFQAYASYTDPNVMMNHAVMATHSVAGLPSQPSATNLHINPAQVLGAMPYGSNPFEADSTNSPWNLSPQNGSPSPVVFTPSPESSTHDTEKTRIPGVDSLKSSRSSSYSNLPGALSESLSHQIANEPHRKEHDRSQPSASAINGSLGNTDTSSTTTCINCKTMNTPLWRRDENGQPLCNACQLFRKLHGSDRPVSLHNSVIKKRNRTRNAKEVTKKTGIRSQARRDSVTSPITTPIITDVPVALSII